jgi:phenylalanyl-tRNA synthetase alpha chain
MSVSILSADEVRRALSVRDQTDPATGPHAMQRLVDDVTRALAAAWRCKLIVQRASPIVPVADNYDRLHYPEDGAARDARYTRYVSETTLLRTQTSAMIPPLLRRLVAAPKRDVLLSCPGLVYRRDRVDRLHTGEPHQLDLWRVSSRESLGVVELGEMIAVVVETLLPGRIWRTSRASHPYTEHALQIDVLADGEWIEIGECGLALPAILAESGLAVPPVTGLAMGLGLDRLLMLRKGIDDIRLLRATDPRVAAQMLDLTPYRAVSTMPPVRRDLSLVVDDGADPEELGDEVRAALGADADVIETVEVLAETPHDELPPAARDRLGISRGQKNVLLRVVLRALDRTLTADERNEIRDRIYAALHRGTRSEWIMAR